jgi:hypothetical protein
LSQYPYDEFSKNFLETLCKPVGEVQAAKTVASEVREIDLYFVPHNPATSLPALGLLQSLITTPVSFEPFCNPVAIAPLTPEVIEHIKSTSQSCPRTYRFTT